jgi:hypothetical protein
MSLPIDTDNIEYEYNSYDAENGSENMNIQQEDNEEPCPFQNKNKIKNNDVYAANIQNIVKNKISELNIDDGQTKKIEVDNFIDKLVVLLQKLKVKNNLQSLNTYVDNQKKSPALKISNVKHASPTNIAVSGTPKLNLQLKNQNIYQAKVLKPTNIEKITPQNQLKINATNKLIELVETHKNQLDLLKHKLTNEITSYGTILAEVDSTIVTFIAKLKPIIPKVYSNAKIIQNSTHQIGLNINYASYNIGTNINSVVSQKDLSDRISAMSNTAFLMLKQIHKIKN